MISEWNTNMTNRFVSGWVQCLDESMSIWFNRFTCPGWVFCPRKPHPFGNKYHSASCGLAGIMFVVELVEGKDRPKELPKPVWENKGKTVSLLLRMLSSYFNTGMLSLTRDSVC